MSRSLMSLREFMRRYKHSGTSVAKACGCSRDTINSMRYDGARVHYDESTRELEIKLRNVTRKGRFSDE